MQPPPQQRNMHLNVTENRRERFKHYIQSMQWHFIRFMARLPLADVMH
jgi:hypothetical protein